MGKEDSQETGTDLIVTSHDDDSEAATLIEITTHIRADQALALELLENAERQRTGREISQAELIREAIDLLIKNSLVAIDLRKKRLLEGK